MNTQIWLQGHKQLLCALLGFWIWPAQAQVLISEIFYDAVGPDNGLTFVELLGTPCTLLDYLLWFGIDFRTVEKRDALEKRGFNRGVSCDCY